METINTRFKSVRKALGKNQTEFAKEIGLTQSSITMIERGERDVLERHIKTICSIFHVNEKWLVDGEGTMFTKEKEKTDLVAWAERMAAEGDTFAHRLAVVISRLTPEQLDTLAEIAEKLVGQAKEAPKKGKWGQLLADFIYTTDSGVTFLVESKVENIFSNPQFEKIVEDTYKQLKERMGYKPFVDGLKEMVLDNRDDLSQILDKPQDDAVRFMVKHLSSKMK